MIDTPRYIIAVHANDQPYFVSYYGGYTQNAREALVFSDRYDAQLYIEKHGLERITSIRRIGAAQKN